LLKFATFVYNNTIHITTSYTPHELAHGFKIQIPNALTKEKLMYNYDNLADNTRNNIARTLELAKEHLISEKTRNQENSTEKISKIFSDIINFKMHFVFYIISPILVYIFVSCLCNKFKRNRQFLITGHQVELK
jgi:hypothetical protein